MLNDRKYLNIIKTFETSLDKWSSDLKWNIEDENMRSKNKIKKVK